MRSWPLYMSLLLTLCISVMAVPGPPQDAVLSNGIRVIIQPRTGTGRVDVSVFIRTVPAQNPTEGAVATVVAHALFYGGRDWVPGYTALVVDQVGGSLETLHTADYTALTVTTVPARLGDAVNLLAEAVRHADFSDYALQHSVRDIIRGRKAGVNKPFDAALDLLEHQFGPFPPPTLQRLRNVTTPQAENYYQSAYLPDRCTISFAGAIRPADALIDVKAYLDDWAPNGNSPLPMVSAPPGRALPIEPLHMQVTGLAGFAMVAFEAPSVTSPDYPAFTVMETLVGVGHASRMFQDLRDREALGYDVGVVWPTDLGMPAVATLQWNGSEPPASRLSDLDTEVADLLSHPPSAAELARARAVAATNFMMQHQRIHNLAFYAGWLQCMGLGTKFDTRFPSLLASVTADDVLRVAQRYLPHRLGLLALPQPATAASPAH